MARVRMPFYQYVHADQLPTGGAMVYGFESEMLAWRPMIGPGIGARFQFASIRRDPQSYQAANVAWVTGLTGIVQGQNIMQPLSNPWGRR